MKINKSFITNFTALIFILLSFIPSLPAMLSNALLFTGLFALSGAVTNQLAIHMLFEKVPFLYGSGVIPTQFEAFKNAIKQLMMKEFFTPENIQTFFQEEQKHFNLSDVIEETDFSPAFDALSKTVMESPFGGMLGMFGGEKALEGLKEPFNSKMKQAVKEIVTTPQFQQNIQKHLTQNTSQIDILQTLEQVIDNRLQQLTPTMVKEMIQQLIQTHLQWLVVWGGVFGGVIGLLSSLFVLGDMQ